MKNIKRILIVLTLTFGFSLASPVDLPAQCPMCKMSAEKNLDGGGSAGKGLNKGILYMLAMPYVLVGAMGYVWYVNRRKEEDILM